MAAPPQIDYLARDFKSFQRMMLDRLATLVPGYRERHAADIGMLLVDILAYAADHLSYQQDAVATEAYLGTARRRISARRHARLLDYRMHDGCNARVMVAIEVSAAGTLPRGTPLLTRVPGFSTEIPSDRVPVALSAGSQIFETMHAITLHPAHNVFDLTAPLPAGATGVTIQAGGAPSLNAGDLLLFEETAEDADPDHRQVVRVTSVTATASPDTVSVSWAPGDALAFPLSPGSGPGSGKARGNVVLADHGQTMPDETLAPVVAGRPYRPSLQRSPITQQGHVISARGDFVPFDPEAPAAAALAFDMRDVRPAVTLQESYPDHQTWLPRGDLLASDQFATELVVEVDDDERAHLRFGDDVLGKLPEPGTAFEAQYRIGNGLAGNVGAEAIAHAAPANDPANPPPPRIDGVRNPLPARGGIDAETLRQTQINAPQVLRFDIQERAVTLDDHAALVKRHPEVAGAAAFRRWNGSFYTIVVVVQRKGGGPVDSHFQAEVRAFLEPYRLLGWDIEIAPPVFVPLEIAMSIQLAPGYLASDVLASLRAALGTGTLPDGRRAFFHPDNWSFGQAIYWSALASAAMDVAGVGWALADPSVTRFRRVGATEPFDLQSAVIQLSQVELPRIDDDPAAPENGTFTFDLRGGQ